MNVISKVRKKAFEYHRSGFHCAEAVSKATIESYGGICTEIPKVATAFGGGIGRTKKEMCGGLAGAFIAIGALYGRNEAGIDWTDASDLAAQLRQKFIQAYGTTKCGALLEAFGPQENMMRCKELSGEVAEMLAVILEEHDNSYKEGNM